MKLSVSKNKKRLTSDSTMKTIVNRVRYANYMLTENFECDEEDENQ
jgi:hypothetical protein